MRALWRDWTDAQAVERRPRPRAAEQPARYGVDEEPAVALASEPATAAGTWPAPGELIALRRRLELGMRQLACGRRAPGERTLRQAVAVLARRDDWRHAAVGAIALAGSLVRRGRAQAALDVLADWRQPDCDAGAPGLLVEAATLAAVAWTDSSADSTKPNRRAGRPSAPRGRKATRRAWPTPPWRSRAVCSGAAGMPTPSVRSGRSPARRSRRVDAALDALAARVSVGLGDAAGGVARAARAVEQAECASDERLLAHARCSGIRAPRGRHSRGGRPGCRGRSARRARGPRFAARAAASGLLAERARRSGRSAAVSRPPAASRAWPGRGAAAGRPRAVRLCAHPRPRRLVEAAARSREPPHHVHWPGRARALRARGPALGCRICSRAARRDRDSRALPARAGRRRGARRGLRAAAAAAARRRRRVFACEAGRLAAVVARGGRVEPAIAGRAIAAGVPVAPHRCDDRIEGAVPVQYAGATIGALAARWTLGSDDPAEAPAACSGSPPRRLGTGAPALLARRSRPPGRRGSRSGGHEPGDRRGAAGDRARGRRAVPRADRRRERQRQGAGRPGGPPSGAAPRSGVLHAELRGHRPTISSRPSCSATRAARSPGAVAERPGVFEEAQRRHAVSRRDRRAVAARPGQAAARAPGRGAAARRREQPRRVDVRDRRRDESRLPGRSVAPARFRLDLCIVSTSCASSCRRCASGARTSPFWPSVLAGGDLAGRQPGDAGRRDDRGARALRRGRATCASCRTCWRRSPCGRRSGASCRRARCRRPSARAGPAERWRLDEARRTFEERFVRAALVRAGGHRARAARTRRHAAGADEADREAGNRRRLNAGPGVTLRGAWPPAPRRRTARQ